MIDSIQVNSTEVAALTATDWHPHYRRSEEPGEEITELCGYIYAAQSAQLGR